MKLIVSSDVNEPDWDNDIIRLNGCCLHAYKWSVYSAENNSATPLYFQLKDDHNQVVAATFGLWNEKRAGIRLYSLLSFGSMPAAINASHRRALAAEILAYCRKNKVVKLSMNSFGMPYDSECMNSMGLATTRRWEFILDISNPEEEIWKNFHSKKRNLIRKGEKSGIIVRRGTDLDFLLKYRTLATDTYNRKTSQGIPYPKPLSESQVKRYKERLIDTGIGRMYLAFKDEDVVAGAFFVGCHSSVYYMLSASNDSGLKSAAPDSILWRAIRDYQKEGYGVFNFGGFSEGELDGNPLETSGLYHFKIRFSPEIVPCLKGHIVLRPKNDQLYQTFARIKNRLRGAINYTVKSLLSKIKNKISGFISEFYRIPYCVPAWGWTEHLIILKCILAGQIIHGPHIKALYEIVRRKTEKKYVIGYNSGREAIQSVLTAHGLGQKDKVILPSYCCETVAQAVIDSGATPIFCDVNEDYNSDVNHILRLVSSEVKAIIFPHLFGKPGRIDLLEAALEKRNLRSQILLIDDAAQSFGARLNHRLVGTFGDAGIISFGPGKTMTASGGGLIITDSEKLTQNIDIMKSLPLNGKVKIKKLIYWVVFRRWRKYSLPFYPFIDRWLVSNITADDKVFQMANVDSAIAIIQIKKLKKLLNVRLERKEKLNLLFDANKLSDSYIFDGSVEEDKAVLNVATKFLAKPIHRIENIQNIYYKYLRENNIEMKCLYTPIHFGKDFKHICSRLPVTEGLWDQVLQIPVEPSIDDKQFEKMVSKIVLFYQLISEKSHATP